MRRRPPLKRVKGLEPRLEQIQAWQRRTRERALASDRIQRRKQQRQRSRARNDAPWRAECAAARGEWCRAGSPASPCQGRLHAHHIIHRSMCGPSVVENGLFLCAHHHSLVHAATIRVRRDWMEVDQIEWLRDEGHVVWEHDGSVSGRHWRLFEPLW